MSTEKGASLSEIKSRIAIIKQQTQSDVVVKLVPEGMTEEDKKEYVKRLSKINAYCDESIKAIELIEGGQKNEKEAINILAQKLQNAFSRIDAKGDENYEPKTYVDMDKVQKLTNLSRFMDEFWAQEINSRDLVWKIDKKSEDNHLTSKNKIALKKAKFNYKNFSGFSSPNSIALISSINEFEVKIVQDICRDILNQKNNISKMVANTNIQANNEFFEFLSRSTQQQKLDLQEFKKEWGHQEENLETIKKTLIEIERNKQVDQYGISLGHLKTLIRQLDNLKSSVKNTPLQTASVTPGVNVVSKGKVPNKSPKLRLSKEQKRELKIWKALYKNLSAITSSTDWGLVPKSAPRYTGQPIHMLNTKTGQEDLEIKKTKSGVFFKPNPQSKDANDLMMKAIQSYQSTQKKFNPEVRLVCEVTAKNKEQAIQMIKEANKIGMEVQAVRYPDKNGNLKKVDPKSLQDSISQSIPKGHKPVKAITPLKKNQSKKSDSVGDRLGFIEKAQTFYPKDYRYRDDPDFKSHFTHEELQELAHFENRCDYPLLAFGMHKFYFKEKDINEISAMINKIDPHGDKKQITVNEVLEFDKKQKKTTSLKNK